MNTESNLSAQAAELLAAFDEVNTSVSDLGNRVDEHQRLIIATIGQYKTIMDRYRLGLTLMAIVLAILAVVTTFGIVLYKAQADNTKHIEDIQTRTSAEIMCPLWGLLINSINSNPNPPGMTQEQKDFRINARVTLLRGHEALGCAPLN